MQCYIAYRASPSTAFAIEAAMRWPIGPYFSSLLATFNAVRGKACASYRWVTLIHHVLESSVVMSYMNDWITLLENPTEWPLSNKANLPERGLCIEFYLLIGFSDKCQFICFSGPLYFSFPNGLCRKSLPRWPRKLIKTTFHQIASILPILVANFYWKLRF